MKKALFLFFTLAMLSGCKNDEPSHQLVGDWLWQVSSGGIGGMKIEPKDNERVVISFTKKGTFSISRNDTLSASGTYRLGSVKSIYTTGEATGIFTNNVVNSRPLPNPSLFLLDYVVITSLTTDRLGIGDNVYDGYGSGFRRLK